MGSSDVAPLSGPRGRVLYICATSPVPSKIGPSRRHYHILAQLIRFYDVHVLSLGTRTEAALFAKEFGHQVTGFDYALIRRSYGATVVRKLWLTLTGRCDFLPSRDSRLRLQLRRILMDKEFDAILLSGSLMNRFSLPRDARIIADSHNVESEVLARTRVLAESFYRRMYARLQTPATRREERRCASRAALQLATSECDRVTFERSLGVPNVAVIPNGVDIAEFSPALAPGDAGAILFTGLMSYYPNQQGIRWFLDKVFPQVLSCFPTARLTIAGARPPRWLLHRASREVIVTGAVPDMRPYFERASVVVVPLMIGGGTRVKILEAQAMQRAVVSTPQGAEGLHVDESTIMLADSADAFAHCVVRLLSDPQLAARIAQNARRRVENEYSWDRIGNKLAATFSARIGLAARNDGNVLRFGGA
jgi:polysaccharide biosynthesis protein PslH